MKPKVVCLIGFPRLRKAFRNAELEETLKGNIVVWFEQDVYANHMMLRGMASKELDEINELFRELRLCRIDLADEVLVIAPGGLPNWSCEHELEYAEKQGKQIRFRYEHELIR